MVDSEHQEEEGAQTLSVAPQPPALVLEAPIPLVSDMIHQLSALGHCVGQIAFNEGARASTCLVESDERLAVFRTDLENLLTEIHTQNPSTMSLLSSALQGFSSHPKIAIEVLQIFKHHLLELFSKSAIDLVRNQSFSLLCLFNKVCESFVETKDSWNHDVSQGKIWSLYVFEIQRFPSN